MMYIDLLLGLFFLHVQHQNSYIPSNDERFTSKSLCAVKMALMNCVLIRIFFTLGIESSLQCIKRAGFRWICLHWIFRRKKKSCNDRPLHNPHESSKKAFIAYINYIFLLRN